jgi:hypothetical protein
MGSTSVMASSIARRVVARHLSKRTAAFISDKWFKAKKSELKDLLKAPLREEPQYWGYLLNVQVEGFLDKFERDFEEIVSSGQAVESIRNRVSMAKDYLKALAAKIEKTGDLRREVDFKDAASYLKWMAVLDCHKKMSEATKVYGDLFKTEWEISEEVIDRLVRKTIKGATKDELAALTGDLPEGNYDSNYAYRLKYDYLARVRFDSLALKALKKSKLDWEPLKWVDRIYEMLAANYSEKAVEEQGGYREFDLHGIKVIVDDKTVLPADIQKYVKYLLEAHAALKSKGFSKAWYGNVFIQCENCGGVNPNTGGGTGGWYETRPDTVTIFSRPVNFVVGLMVHELGHRYWYKQMTESQRGRFAELVQVHTKLRPENPVDVKMFGGRDLKNFQNRIEECGKNARHNLEQSKKFDLERVDPETINLVEKAFFSIGLDITDIISELIVEDSVVKDFEVSSLRGDVWKAKKELTTRSNDLSLQRVETFDEWVSDMSLLISKAITSALTYVGVASQKHNEASRAKLEADPKTKEWVESYEKNPAPVIPVSSYGESNIDEAFAEVFTHYVLDYSSLDRDQLESFRSVLSSVPSANVRAAHQL